MAHSGTSPDIGHPHPVISTEAGRRLFFRVRSGERVGLRGEKSLFSFLNGHGGAQVTWTYLGIVQFAPAFLFECSQCGNHLQGRILNGTAGFPESPTSV